MSFVIVMPLRAGRVQGMSPAASITFPHIVYARDAKYTLSAPFAAAAAADVAAVVINRIVNRKLCLCFVSLLACSTSRQPPQSALEWGVVIIINNIVVAGVFGGKL